MTSATPGTVRSAGRITQSSRRAPLRERELGAVDREHEHFAERARDRRQAAADALGQIARNVGQTFGDLIARPVDVGAVLEIDRDVG